jgi:hypothetical protein
MIVRPISQGTSSFMTSASEGRLAELVPALKLLIFSGFQGRRIAGAGVRDRTSDLLITNELL